MRDKPNRVEPRYRSVCEPSATARCTERFTDLRHQEVLAVTRSDHVVSTRTAYYASR
jgi:hypothetical protein